MHERFPVPVKRPIFLTASGEEAVVVCSPVSLYNPGTYNVSCIAKDNKTKAVTQCDYVVSARQVELHRGE